MKNLSFLLRRKRMSATIVTYEYKDERERVDKSEMLGNPRTFEGTFKGEFDLTNPIIELNIPNIGEQSDTYACGFNYVWIVEYNRFYFVDSATCVRSGLWRYQLHCDLLMTYKDSLLEQRCMIARCEKEFDEYKNDPMVPTKNTPIIEYQVDENAPWYAKDNDKYIPTEDYCLDVVL